LSFGYGGRIMATTGDSTKKSNSMLLVLGALGIVFGDIGTSPLYTIQECVNPVHGVSASVQANLFGLVSLIFWALMMIVTLKYVVFMMRADNRGEGGIMALLALLPENVKMRGPGKVGITGILVIIGAALLFGDGVITPAISVLSAVEGLKVVSPALEAWVVPLTLLILIALFAFQKHGTEKIGNAFGPIMLVWFACLGILGLMQIAHFPGVIQALSPVYAVDFFELHGWHAFRMLGSVVLAVTGGEALYADMGHFGKIPIRKAWLYIVFPCLVLNYLGQAAFLITHPDSTGSPFFNMVPQSFLYPMIALATLATVIASQALISGAYSLTSQAIRLGYFPRLTVKHTSEHGEGQIYIPFINLTLAILCIALVLVFQESSKLAAAYGLAVTGTMTITSLVYFQVTRHKWKWKPALSWLVLLVFLAFDIPFFLANVLKFVDGGWIPVFIGSFFFLVMLLWKMGRSLLARHFMRSAEPLDAFLNDLEKQVPYRIPGTGVFLASDPNGVPPVVLRMVRRFHSLHANILLLTVTSETVPYFCRGGKCEDDRVEVQNLGKGFHRVLVRYGYMEMPDIPSIMEKALVKLEMNANLKELVYVLGHETFVEQESGEMNRYQQGIFSFLSRNARNATDYFKLPPDQVIELGTHIDL
jgi:KUP system potassium uptake protein